MTYFFGERISSIRKFSRNRLLNYQVLLKNSIVIARVTTHSRAVGLALDCLVVLLLAMMASWTERRGARADGRLTQAAAAVWA
jgi:hypothetical protein